MRYRHSIIQVLGKMLDTTWVMHLIISKMGQMKEWLNKRRPTKSTPQSTSTTRSRMSTGGTRWTKRRLYVRI